MDNKTEQGTNMQFKEGTHVYTSDGEDVGGIDRVVLDPQTDNVTGLVVRQGWLFTEDKVVPIDLVETTTEDRVTLRKSAASLHKLPVFENTYYVPVKEEDYGDETPDVPYASTIYGYPPVGVAWWGYGGYLGYPPVELEPQVAERTEQNIPQGDVAVKEGARVISQDGEHVGNVEEIFADPETNHVTHIVISQGLVFKERKLIPTNWISVPGEDEVILTVNTDVVHRLPEYKR